MPETAETRLCKLESGFHFDLPRAEAVDGDAWLSPISGDGVHSVDFLVRRVREGLWFIEAKSSAPRPESAGGERGRLRLWCQTEVVPKFAHTAQVLLAAAVGRGLSRDIERLAWIDKRAMRAPWTVVLVLPSFEPPWLISVRDTLREALRPLHATTGFALEPKVLNTELAMRLGLGSPTEASRGADLVPATEA